MLFPRSHIWTLRQKRLIITSALWGTVLFAGAVYTYEHYYRGPSESAFYGIWEDVDTLEDGSGPIYWAFHPNQTFTQFYVDKYTRERSDFSGGRWYAGGRNLYLAFHGIDDAQSAEPNRPLVCSFDIASDHLGIGPPHGTKAVWFLRRVGDPEHLTNR